MKPKIKNANESSENNAATGNPAAGYRRPTRDDLAKEMLNKKHEADGSNYQQVLEVFLMRIAPFLTTQARTFDFNDVMYHCRVNGVAHELPTVRAIFKEWIGQLIDWKLVEEMNGVYDLPIYINR